MGGRMGAGQAGADFLLIVNPASQAGRTGRRWARTEARLAAAGLRFETALTTRPQEATEIARRAVREGRPVVVSVGGDGTLNEVVNGFFEQGEPIPSSSRLGLIPAGTGGDTRRTFGIPNDAAGAAAILRAGHERVIDAGRVRLGSRWVHFVNVAEAGLGANVSDRVNRAPKVLGGRASFYLGTLAGVASWRHKPMRVRVDGEAVADLVAQQVVVANCQFYGGGMHVAPRAQPDDGLFDVLVVAGLGKLESIGAMGKLYSGTHLDDPKLAGRIEFLRGRQVEVTSPEPVLVQVEGEVVGNLPARFEIQAKALRLLVPAA